MIQIDKRIKRAAYALVFLLALASCKNTYEMQVDAISNPNPTIGNAESYVIVPRDPETDTRDLRYQETVKWVKTALSAKGLYEANDPLEADMVVEIDYGMEPPRQEIQIRQEPVFQRIQERGTYRTISRRDPTTGKILVTRIYVPGRVSNELVGYQERAVSVTVNEKYMVLTAKENKMAESGDDAAEELWSVTVTNLDDSDDLREYLPIMASAATDYIGEDTESAQTIKLKSDDEVVVFIKEGLEKKNPLYVPQQVSQ